MGGDQIFSRFHGTEAENKSGGVKGGGERADGGGITSEGV